MCDCDCDNQSDSGFVFGLVLGAVIGAVVAIYIYKNRRTEIFENLKTKLEKYFKDFKKPDEEPDKVTVTLPKKVEVLNLYPPKRKKNVKLFKK